MLEYGYSYFLMALEELTKSERQKIKDMAIAVRLGRFADDKAWTKIMDAKD